MNLKTPSLENAQRVGLGPILHVYQTELSLFVGLT